MRKERSMHWCRSRLGSVLLLGFMCTCRLAEPSEPAKQGYSPVTPPAAVHAALRLELKVAQEWIKDKDFASAIQSCQGLTSLAHLYSNQGSEPVWRTKTSDLANSFSQLASAA